MENRKFIFAVNNFSIFIEGKSNPQANKEICGVCGDDNLAERNLGEMVREVPPYWER